MILAGIDIGTNSLRLLVAEVGPGSFSKRYLDRKITRLGQDLDSTGRLSPDAAERSLDALLDFMASIRRHAALHIKAVGTSALRNASNAAAFLVNVKKRTGLDINVISGEEEARLTLLGVAHALKGPGAVKGSSPASVLVLDVGGGSTEIILTSSGSEPMIASLPLGAVYLTERFIKQDPPSSHEIEVLRREIRALLDQHAGGMRPGPGGKFVGTAGTITTLAAMDQELAEYNPEKINQYTITKETIDAIIHRLSTSTLEQRRAIPGLEKGREDIILAGAVVTQELMKQFGFSTMLVSDWGLQEGLVLDLYEKITQRNIAKPQQQDLL
jgi:exopolyphosphatase/guanosine-5'-triphosphate,3'-diphosphate pyrophosphatase